MTSSAILSSDRVYRYALFRRWDEGRRELVVIGLNPSTADETADDPTIRRCIGFAKRERCAALVMLNLYAFRATAPEVMFAAADPIGPENDAIIQKHAWGDDVICLAAWGVHGGKHGRDEQVRRFVPALNCLGLTMAGHPRHPLYVRADRPFTNLSAARAAQLRSWP